MVEILSCSDWSIGSRALVKGSFSSGGIGFKREILIKIINLYPIINA